MDVHAADFGVVAPYGDRFPGGVDELAFHRVAREVLGRVAVQELMSATPVASKSARLPVTTVTPCTMAVAAISASRSTRRPGTRTGNPTLDCTFWDGTLLANRIATG